MSSEQKPFCNENEVESYLKRSRFNSGKTLKEVALEIGVNKSTCSKWENGECLPSLAIFDKVVEAYDIENETEFRNLLEKVSERKKDERKFRRSLRSDKKKPKEKSQKPILREILYPDVFRG